ncbi:MAG TPA: site-specific DNA-methyltransferase [Anaerolineales bacterium]|nr:site-specific DNA-methyltransferase [Anaerolineales bacterium]HLO33341.1 site-specific DNA-methyltransferase [Anaerolineales bacterium]
MSPIKKASTPKLSDPVDSVNHKDKRANIPTEELRDFIAEEEKAPKTVLYPRDPSLDPQLVWKGKDEQDAQDLAVPAVPIYIQEHIKPQNIVELVRSEAKKDEPQQPMLFSDFNGLTFEDRVDFYHHEQNWSNRMILGDSLMVMTSLAQKEGLKGKVQMIYFDPPYGIKFGSNWQVSTRKRDVKDGRVEDTTRQPEQVKAFRDTWQLGIHSYLAYLRDRLITARELISESGSIFVQIGDENVHLVRALLDEVFGSENYVGLITFNKTTGAGSPAIGTLVLASVTDYIIWYTKSSDHIKYRQLYSEKDDSFDPGGKYSSIELETGERTSINSVADENGGLPTASRVFRLDNMTSQSSPPIPFQFNGKGYTGGWKTNNVGLQRLTHANRIESSKTTLNYVRYTNDFSVYPLNNIWTDVGGIQSRIDPKIYVVQTNTKVIERCMLMSTDPGDLVLDPTCGSGSTAYVAEQWGRRWITIDTSRVSIALARTRLMAGRFPYYLLADSVEGRKKESELTGTFATSETEPSGDIKRGFVYERVPHVTLKSIANNEEIDEIHTKYQDQLEDLRKQINKAAKKNWEEWEIPRTVDSGQLSVISEPLERYWKLRRDRQREIDASIARRADTEFLYDKPYQDNKRIRVSGPFTVESLSPHRVLTTDDPATSFREDTLNTQDFTQMILENLKTSGVQNTIKNQRLKFERLEPFAGTWIHAVADYTEKDGTPRRAAISIGPELGTVSPEQVKEAAKEAVHGVGFDLLIVCGFAFDPHVSEEAKRYGNLSVLPTRMNPDLAMGDELLKKTGAGNLFMVFGEPDLDIKRENGKVIVQLKGLDVYDPTTGEIRSNSTDDIACWFIDTDYNEETFIVRHAYFTGADNPYDKLKRALRAEIDESAWSALYSTQSYPFEKPRSGKIAVKVINHYGDEVLKVYAI